MSLCGLTMRAHYHCLLAGNPDIQSCPHLRELGRSRRRLRNAKHPSHGVDGNAWIHVDGPVAGFRGACRTASCFEDKRGFTQVMIGKKASEVDILRCPLCWALTRRGAIEHLKAAHRRTEIEAREIMERTAEGTLGWDPETRKKRAALRTWRIGH